MSLPNLKIPIIRVIREIRGEVFPITAIPRDSGDLDDYLRASVVDFPVIITSDACVPDTPNVAD